MEKNSKKSGQKIEKNVEDKFFTPCEIFFSRNNDKKDVFSYLIGGKICKKKAEGICPFLIKNVYNELPTLYIGENFDILMLITKDGVPLWKKEYIHKKGEKKEIIDSIHFTIFAGTFSALNATFSSVVGGSIGLVKSANGTSHWLVNKLGSSNWILIAQTKSTELSTVELFEQMCETLINCINI